MSVVELWEYVGSWMQQTQELGGGGASYLRELGKPAKGRE